MKLRKTIPLLLTLSLLSLTRPAGAVIKVDLPVSKIYETARAVVLAEVVKVNPDNRVVEVKVSQTLKGEPPAEQFRIQIAAPAELIKQVAVAGPAVLFVGKAKLSVVHLADQWLLAEQLPNVTPPAFRVIQEHKDARGSFPGRTAALAKIVGEIKAGKSTLLDAAENKVFAGGVKELAKLPVKQPSSILAADLDGDKKPELIVGTLNGIHVFAAKAGGYEEVTEKLGLKGASGGALVGDVDGDGKPDLLLGRNLWLNKGGRFVDAKMLPFNTPAPDRIAHWGPTATEFGYGLADLSGNGKLDLAILVTPGWTLHQFKNPAKADVAWPALPERALPAAPVGPIDKDPTAAFIGDWGDDGKPCVMAVRESGIFRYRLDGETNAPVDFQRLTGSSLEAIDKAFAGGLKNVLACPIDINGDHRPDLLVIADGGAMVLVNRGFGAYLVNVEVSEIFANDKKPLPFKLRALWDTVKEPLPKTCLAPIDLRGDGFESLLVLTEEGKLFVVENLPPAGGR